MENTVPYSMLLHFAREVEDFRTGNRLYYPSSSILFMAFLGVLCGAEDWEEVVEVAESSKPLLRKHLGEEYVGIPSHDTFCRFFSLVKPQAMETAFRKIMFQLHSRLSNEQQKGVIAIDGKYMSGVTDESALNVVSAFATATGICLGQEVAERKMNEPQMLRKLIHELNIKGTVITADALHCQKESVRDIIETGGDYLITVKANQRHLYEGIAEGIRVETLRNKSMWIDQAEQVTQGHGRYEKRICYSCSHPGWLPKCGHEWAGVKSFGTMTSERTIVATGETSIDTRCFISSLQKDALSQLQMMRSHWNIENNLHWQLDISFREDDTRMNKNQLLNLSLLRKMAMPVLKAFTYKKGASMKKKMLAAALKPTIKDKLMAFALKFYEIS